MENASGGREGSAGAMFVLEQLKPPYDEFFQQKAWERYVAALNEEGLAWWFNMDIPVLAAHLVPLASASSHVAIPPRLQFLSEAIHRTATSEILETYYGQFLDSADMEAASAVVGAAIMSAWEIGVGFDRFSGWHEKIKDLLTHQGSLPPLATAALFYYQGIIVQFAECNHIKVKKAAERVLAWSERAGANNLRTHGAIHYLHSCIWNTHFRELESKLSDVKALCDLPDVQFPAKALIRSHLGAYEMIRGRFHNSESILEKIVQHKKIMELPAFLWMIIASYAILYAACIGDMAALRRLSGEIQDRNDPTEVPFHISFFHYNLGLAFLNMGELDKAFLHAQLSEKKGKESKSPEPENHVGLLKSQVLSDMGDFDAAEQILGSRQGYWASNGHNLYAIASKMEMANILIRKGKKEEAREKYANVRRLWPIDSPVYVYARPAAFVQKIESSLFSACEAADLRPAEAAQPIHIQTFGELKVHMGSGAIYDRHWKGTRLKQLLKALIVLGATDVPAERLIRLLWPDTDNAAASLKAAVWRLRRLGCEKDDDPPPWIRLQNRRVSLSPALCRVDAVRFRTRLAAALSDGDDIDGLRAALDLYTDDFLKNDVNDPWIVRHREALKSEFTSGALALIDRCEKMDRTEAALPYLEKAIDRRPPSGDLYARLMTCHIRMGEPSRAHQIYRRAEDALGGDQDADRSAELRRLAALLGN